MTAGEDEHQPVILAGLAPPGTWCGGAPGTARRGAIRRSPGGGRHRPSDAPGRSGRPSAGHCRQAASSASWYYFFGRVKVAQDARDRCSEPVAPSRNTAARVSRAAVRSLSSRDGSLPFLVRAMSSPSAAPRPGRLPRSRRSRRCFPYPPDRVCSSPSAALPARTAPPWPSRDLAAGCSRRSSRRLAPTCAYLARSSSGDMASNAAASSALPQNNSTYFMPSPPPVASNNAAANSTAGPDDFPRKPGLVRARCRASVSGLNCGPVA